MRSIDTVKRKGRRRREREIEETRRGRERERSREGGEGGTRAKQHGKRGKKESIQRAGEGRGEACGFGQPVGSPSAGTISGP